MALRAARDEDEGAVVALWHACELVVSYNNPGLDFQNAIHSVSSAVLVFEDECKKIVETVLVGHDGHRGWLYYVATAPEIRGQGIGRRMVQAAEDWLRQRGVQKAQLLVRDANARVVSFYEHLGFESAPRVVMGKWLKPEP